MTLANFYAEIKTDLRRGSSSDADIPRWTKRALLWLEQNYTFNYMNKMVQANLIVEDDSNLIIMAQRPKVLRWVRAVPREGPGRFRYLKKITVDELASIDQGDPNYYWVEDMTKLYLDSLILEPLSIQIGAAFYTTFPTDTSQSVVMLDYYENLLHARTLLEAALSLKDERMVAGYQQDFQLALTAVLVAEEEQDREGTELQMRYVG